MYKANRQNKIYMQELFMMANKYINLKVFNAYKLIEDNEKKEKIRFKNEDSLEVNIVIN